jgi:lauroyl/myristoyl acyltransferase
MSVTSADLKTFLMLTALGVVAWFTPERWWYSSSQALVKVSRALFGTRATRVPSFLVELAGVSPDSASVKSSAMLHWDTLEVLRCHRPGGWKPDIKLDGEQRLAEAKADGKGAILWVADTASASLIAKMALAQNGYYASHLSRPDHGFSTSPFGVRFLNPVRTRVEDQYIAERVLMSPKDRSQALRVVRRRLSEGRFVSITVLNDGTQTRSVRLFDSEALLPTGPVTLSRSTGAPLVPLFVVRKGPAEFEVVIEQPIRVPDGRDYDTPLREYASLLEQYVKADPLAWLGWQR